MGSQNIVYGLIVQTLLVKCQHLIIMISVFPVSWTGLLRQVKYAVWGRFWVVAGRVRQVVLETRFILIEKTLGGIWCGLYRQVVS